MTICVIHPFLFSNRLWNLYSNLLLHLLSTSIPLSTSGRVSIMRSRCPPPMPGVEAQTRTPFSAIEACISLILHLPLSPTPQNRTWGGHQDTEDNPLSSRPPRTKRDLDMLRNQLLPRDRPSPEATALLKAPTYRRKNLSERMTVNCSGSHSYSATATARAGKRSKMAPIF